MNLVLWTLQVLAALLYAASGVMKVFMLDEVSADVPSFGALPREAWIALGIVELVLHSDFFSPAAPTGSLLASQAGSRRSAHHACLRNISPIRA